MKMAVAIVFAFMLCQLPRAILFLLVLHVGNALCCASYPLRNCTIFIVFSLFECPPKLFGKTSLN